MGKETSKELREDVVFISKSQRFSIHGFTPEERYADGKLKKREGIIQFEGWAYVVKADDEVYQKKINFIREHSDGIVREGSLEELNRVRAARMPQVQEAVMAGRKAAPELAQTDDFVAATPEEVMKDNG